MKVLFLKNIKNVAQVGDVKDVSDGYAMNFLIPRKLAKAATGAAIKQSETLKSNREASNLKDKENAQKLALKLEGVVVELKEGANDEGHLYGSIDAKKIASAINSSQNTSLTADSILIEGHLKKTGDHSVKVELYKPHDKKDQTILTTLIIRVLPS